MSTSRSRILAAIRHRLAAVRPVGKVDMLACTYDLQTPLLDARPPGDLIGRWAGPADLPILIDVMEPYRAEIPSFGGGGHRRIRRHIIRHGTLREEFHARHEAGDLCYIAEDQGSPVYMGWVSFRHASLPRLGLEIPLVPAEAYLDGLFVLPSHRGRRLATVAGTERLWLLRQQGIRFAYSWVSPRNAPVLKIQKRVGWRHVARVSQIYMELGRRIPLLSFVVLDPADPLALWCSPQRLTFRRGLTFYRRGPVRISSNAASMSGGSGASTSTGTRVRG